MRIKLFTMLLIGFIALAFVSVVQAQAVYDTVSIYDLQYVPDPVADDLSPLLGDTVTVRGLVMHYPNELWIGNRWAMYIVDPDSFPNPWSGFFIVCNDTESVSATQTQIQFLQPGDIAYFTGHVEEFNSFSQINIYGFSYIPDPVIPVDIESSGNPLPDPRILTAADLAGPAAAEQWESMFVRVEDGTIVNNSISGNWASFTDPSGSTGYIAEYFYWFYNRLPAQYQWPAPGTNLNVVGFTRDESGAPGRVYSVNPRDTLDLEIQSKPPVVTNELRNPGVPSSSDAVTVSATIVDNGTVADAQLHYSVNWAPFQSLTMTANVDTFSATIPAQANGSFVRYLITTVDNVGDASKLPGDTTQASGRVFFYDVKDGGLSIRDVQYTHGYAVDISGYVGYEVTLEGVVVTDSTDWLGNYYIEEKDSAWYGMWVANNQTFNKGDWVQVTGTVQENFNVTRLNNVTSQQVVTPNFGLFNPVLVTTGEVTTGGVNSEAYESVYLRLENLTVTNPFADAPSNFGEFEVNDNSGDYRVDDSFSAFRGNLDSTFGLGDQIGALEGVGYYSFGDYKLLPRDTNDVINHVPVGIEEVGGPVPVSFNLDQNYPNPFNPTTEIRYQIADAGDFRLVIHNVLGQKIRTLANDFHSVGTYRVQWDGLDEYGNRVGSGIYFYTLRGNTINLTRKMIMLK